LRFSPSSMGWEFRLLSLLDSFPMFFYLSTFPNPQGRHTPWLLHFAHSCEDFIRRRCSLLNEAFRALFCLNSLFLMPGACLFFSHTPHLAAAFAFWAPRFSVLIISCGLTFYSLGSNLFAFFRFKHDEPFFLSSEISRKCGNNVDRLPLQPAGSATRYFPKRPTARMWL